MILDENTIFLDSNVVAGAIAVGKDGNSSQKTEKNLEEWGGAIKKLANKLSPDSYKKLIVPTPICYELMAWNPKWFQIVSDTKNDPLFKYSNYDIKNDILKVGAKYAYESKTGTGSDNQSAKLKTMDPLLAAYSIKHKCCILTENECDFPESHFEVVGIEVLKLIGSDKNLHKKQRSILYLLKPKTG